MPIVAFAASAPTARATYVLRYRAAAWDASWSSVGWGAVGTDRPFQLATDGAGFLLVGLQKLLGDGTVSWRVNTQRIRLGVGTTPAWSDPVRIRVEEAGVDLQANGLAWVGVPRRLGSETVPLFYVRDKATDELVARAYDAQAPAAGRPTGLFGPGWASSAEPRLELLDGQSRAVSWDEDGGQFTCVRGRPGRLRRPRPREAGAGPDGPRPGRRRPRGPGHGQDLRPRRPAADQHQPRGRPSTWV